MIIVLDFDNLDDNLNDYWDDNLDDNCVAVCKDIDIVIHLADIVAGINFVFANELFV